MIPSHKISKDQAACAVWSLSYFHVRQHMAGQVFAIVLLLLRDVVLLRLSEGGEKDLPRAADEVRVGVELLQNGDGPVDLSHKIRVLFLVIHRMTSVD